MIARLNPHHELGILNARVSEDSRSSGSQGKRVPIFFTAPRPDAGRKGARRIRVRTFTTIAAPWQ